MKLLTFISAILLMALQYSLWFSQGGLLEVDRLKNLQADLTLENKTLAKRNAILTAEVLDLKTGLAAIEEQARGELGLVGKKETFYQQF